MKVWRQAFLIALRSKGKINESADIVGVGRQTVYDLRKSDPAFESEVQQALSEHRSREESSLIRQVRSLVL